MKAIELGSDARPRWRTVPEPYCGENDVLIGIRSSGVNRADLAQREGRYPPPAGAPPYLGLECAGLVTEIGANVTGLVVGDEICALLPGGGYAQRVAVDYRLTLPIPSGLPLMYAGGLVETACTVWSNLIDLGGLSAGEVLLVHGGASGIGTTAIQVAKALGATVVVTARGPVKRTICERLGADMVIDYEQEDFVAKVQEFTDGRGADVILDVRGGDYLARNLDSLARRGRLLIVGVQGGSEGVLPIGVLLQKAASVTAASLRNRPLQEKAAVVAGVRRDIWPLVERGAVTPVIDSVYRIQDAEAAHDRMSSGDHIGKLLLVQAGARPMGTPDTGEMD